MRTYITLLRFKRGLQNISEICITPALSHAWANKTDFGTRIDKGINIILVLLQTYIKKKRESGRDHFYFKKALSRVNK